MISIGIDAAKDKSMVCILKEHGEILKSPYEISHTKKDLTELINTIKELREEVKVIIEVTGYYHMPVVKALTENDIFISVVNALVMKKHASISIRKGKTDKIDAVKIAQYGIINWFDLIKYTLETECYRELKTLSRQYYQHIGLRIKAKVTINNLLDKVMPGITTLLTNSSQDSKKDKLYSFVSRYWHYDNITKMSEKRFIESYLAWAKKEGYHQSISKAKEIYAIALNGIPVLDSSTPSTKMLILESIRVHREIEKTLTVILTQMQELASGLVEYPVIRSMKGIGDKLATRFIAEVGDVSRFHNAKAIVAFAGLDTPPYQSGNFTGTKQKISKRGSRYLRKTGYEIMVKIKSAKPQEDSAVYDFMQKKEAEGKAKKVAIMAGLNKFLHIYYARVKEEYTKKEN